MQFAYDFAVLVATTLAVVAINYASGSVYPEPKLQILEGEGFVSYLVPNSEHFGAVRKCSVNFMGLTYEVNLESASDYVGDLKSGEIISRFSKTECGLRVNFITEKVTGKWILIAANGSSAEENAILEVTVSPLKSDPPLQVTNITAAENADTVRIECPYEPNNRYCEVVDGYGKVSPNICAITATRKINERSWTCRTFVWGSQNAFVNEYNVEFVDKRNEGHKRVLENDESIVLMCMPGKPFGSKKCMGHGPSGQMLQISEGLSSRNYTSYNTQLTAGICALELKKPIASGDYGTWRILEIGSDIIPKGCVFTVDDGNKLRRKRSLIPETIDVQGLSAITLKCEYSAEIEFCFIQDPDGNLKYLTADKNNLPNAQTTGLCAFSIIPKQGEWICSIKAQGVQELQQTYYNIRVFTDLIIEAHESTVVKSDDNSVNLLCKTVFGYTIKFCNFMSPKGNWYAVSETDSPHSSRISYYGHGLNMGECGITITDLETADFGNWTCSVQVNSFGDGLPQSLKILLDTKNISNAVIGISVAVSVLLATILIFIIYRFRSNATERRRLRTEHVVRMSTASDD